MNDLVKIKNGVPLVNSKDVGDKFDKNHRDVLRAIKLMDCSPEFRARNFAQSSYTSSQNKVLDCFDMTKDGFAFLCMGFTGKEASSWKEKYIEAFNSMNNTLNGSLSVMDSFNKAVALMEKDKDIASLHGRELAKYKKIKKGHEKSVNALVIKSQQLLDF